MMPRFIVKLDDLYFEWSTVVDAPVTDGMTETEFRQYYRDEYGRHGYAGLEERLERANATGTSAYRPYTLKYLLETNHAGDNGERLTRQEIFDKYC